MSYPRDLDDTPTPALEAEIKRRTEALKKGLCPYCNTDLDKHTCKYAGRVADYHKAPTKRKRDR